MLTTKQELQEFRTKVNEIKWTKKGLEGSLSDHLIKQAELTEYGIFSLEARAIIQSVSENTQNLMIRYFTSLISPLLQAVWQDSREFKMGFVQRRNVTECDCFIEKDGNRADIFASSGGGLADVVSLGCRVAFHVLERKSRKLMILDEPFSSLNSIQYQEAVSKVVKELSDRLGIQFIFVSDQGFLLADRLFRVSDGVVSIVD